jgi:8-oxo-dGTP diphosphatase
VLINNGKALIIKRTDSDTFGGMWEIPSGKREIFEKTKDAVKREFKEETGIDIEVLNPINVFEFKTEKDTEVRDATQISFLVKAVNGVNVVLSPEHQDYAWVKISEIEKYNLSPETSETLKMAFKYVTIIGFKS